MKRDSLCCASKCLTPVFCGCSLLSPSGCYCNSYWIHLTFSSWSWQHFSCYVYLAVASAVNNVFQLIGWFKLKTVPLAVSPGAVRMVWALWISFAFSIRKSSDSDHMSFTALPCSLWFMEGTVLPRWNQNLLCSLQLFFAYTLILSFGIQKAEKIHEKNASRDGMGRLSTQFYGIVRMRFSLCNMSLDLLKYWKTEVKPPSSTTCGRSSSWHNLK